MMANCVLEDMHMASMGVVVFPRTYKEQESKLRKDAVLTISGKVMVNEDGPPEIVLDGIFDSSNIPTAQRLFIKGQRKMRLRCAV